MRKRIFAGLLLSLVFCSAACASEWTSYFRVGWSAVTGYVSDKWHSITGGKSEPVSSDETLPKEIASQWDGLTDSLNDALTLRDKQETLPSSSWLPFTEDKQSNSRKINKLLDNALAILVKGDAGKIRSDASRLRDEIAKQRLELDDLRNKRITAPETSKLFWRLTKAKADEKIAALQEEIQVSEEKLRAVNSQLTEALREIGLELDEQQTEILLNSVTGDDLLQNTVVFANVKAVVGKLEELSQNDTNSLEITRRYTGMYLVLNDLLIHTQEELIRKIDREYKPQLNVIMNEAESLRRDAITKSRQRAYTDAQRAAFATNAEANEMTIRVAKLYVDLLNSQRAGTVSSVKSLTLNRDLAENTYRTVRSSGELRGLIHSGLKVFDAVGALSMPELKVFESGIMRAEFEEINRRLKK